MMCAAAAPRGLTGHITGRYKLSVRNQMSEKAPWRGILEFLTLQGTRSHTHSHTLPDKCKAPLKEKHMETSKCAQIHTCVYTQTSPHMLGFRGWLVRDNERLGRPPTPPTSKFTVWFSRSLV